MTFVLHNPDNLKPIDELFVFMSIDEQGRHGIVAGMVDGFGATPLVTGSSKAAEIMKPIAEIVAIASGKPVGLFRFKRDTQLWCSDAGENPR